MARVRLLDRNGVSIELDESHPAAARLSKPKPKRRSKAKAEQADAEESDEK